MSLKSITRSFAGGEVSPLLYGRLDLAKYQTGLAKCLNFVVTPQGPVQNRPGFEYVLKAKYSDRKAVVLPFSYSSEQTFALEFGHLYIRFHTNGATLLEAEKNITGITQDNPGVVTIAGHGWADGDWVYLSGIEGMSELNGRWVVVATATANTFTLKDLFGADIDTTALTAYLAGGAAARVYELATPYTESSLFDLHYVQSADVLTITHPTWAPRELRRLGATNWTLTPIDFVATIGTPQPPNTVPVSVTPGTPTAESYVATAIADSTQEESQASGAATENIDLTQAGNYVHVQPGGAGGVNDVAGAIRYNVYKARGGVYGYIGQAAMGGGILVDNNIEPDMSKTPPLVRTPFTGAGNYPRAVSYFEQRRAFAGTTNKPQNIDFTRSGTESNMSYSIPTQDDDAIAGRIVAREANTIRHLVPLGDLLALTSGGVWRISASDGSALTPATLSVRPQSYVGASNVQPMVTSESVLYAPDRGSHIREVAYKWESQNYQADDISVLAPHLFDYKTIKQLAYSRAPLQILWAVRDDGVLLGLTHTPEHEVKAWHQHDTQGWFESVCSVAEGDEDGTYVVVRRLINGHTVRYIERMHTRQFDDVEDAFFLDAGLTYSGPAASTITGLWHLEGEEVVALAAGGVEAAQTVENGSITLSAEATPVHVGLGYNADLQTLPLASEALQAFGQGVVKNVNEVKMRVQQSSSIKAGPSFDALTEYRQRTDEPYGSPPNLVDGVIGFKVAPKWQQDGAMCVRQANPLPLTLVSLTTEVEVGG